MRLTTCIAIGAFSGLLLAAASVFAFGLIVESMGVVLYRSEAEQQRNFNVALGLLALGAVAGAWLGYLRSKRLKERESRGGT